MTAPSSIREIAARLAAAGVASPEWDARALSDHAAATGILLESLVERRMTREPLQHILGVAWFRHLELAVGPGVFVPRPETEVVVDAALAALRDVDSALVVDLCAGSGAIGLAIAQERAMAGRSTVVHFVEASFDAMKWLQLNENALAAQLGSLPSATSSLTLHHADLADAPDGLDGQVDLVVSNPPYLPLPVADEVDVETSRHEPELALWGGDDGLEVVHRVITRAATLLRSGGTLVIEHDASHDLTEALSGWRAVSAHQDLTGRPRFTVAEFK